MNKKKIKSKIVSHKHDLKRGVDFIGANVVFFCHDGDGRLLLQKRSNKCRDEQGRWDCGAGSMEFGESFEEALKREVEEEYGTKIKEFEIAGINNVVRNNDGIKTHWVAVIFAVKLNPKEVTIGDPDKIEEIDWFYIDDLPTPVHSFLFKNIEFVKKLGIFPPKADPPLAEKIRKNGKTKSTN